MVFIILKENKNILDKWLEFRAEDLARLDSKDKEHLPHIDKYIKDILDNITIENRIYISNQLEKLSDEFLSYSSYFMDKYYIYGFKDCLNLILFNLGGE